MLRPRIGYKLCWKKIQLKQQRTRETGWPACRNVGLPLRPRKRGPVVYHNPAFTISLQLSITENYSIPKSPHAMRYLCLKFRFALSLGFIGKPRHILQPSELLPSHVFCFIYSLIQIICQASQILLRHCVNGVSAIK